MPERISRRLPGVYFSAATPPVDPLPRMDIAVFVGFASEGPLHVPVALENAAEFAAIFGGDALVSWDAARGEEARGFLGPAVRAFFRNGGQRCWVVRVAGVAVTNVFPVTGLLRACGGELVPAVARARSKGSASDSLSVGAALVARPLTLEAVSFSGPSADLITDANSEVRAGDLLRFTFRTSGLVWMLPVRAVEASGRRVRAVGDPAATFWFRKKAPATLSPGMRADTFEGERAGTSFNIEEAAEGSGEETELQITAPMTSAPVPGSFVRVDWGAEELWLRVREARLRRPAGSLPEAISIIGPALSRVKAGLSSTDTAALVTEPVTVERLSLDLWTRRGDAPPQRLVDLGLGQRHPRFWGALPTDEELYRARLQGEALTDLRAAAATPRYPLAGDGKARPKADPERESFYLPVGMAFAADVFLGAVRRYPGRLRSAPLVRNGLGRFRKALFLDPALAETPAQALLGEADFLRYQSPAARELRGIHAALGVEEATLIAVPDAVHRRWKVVKPEPFDDGSSDVPAAPSREPGVFHDCRVPLDAPSFVRPVTADETGTFTLRWTGDLDPFGDPAGGARYVVEESPDPTFSPSTAIYAGTAPALTIWGRPSGTLHYRARIENAAGPGPWSSRLSVRVGGVIQATLEDAAEYGSESLLDVQRALLRMSAARGDMLAILALPEHFRELEAIDHAAAVEERMGAAEAATLSYGALYHPWLATREDAGVRRAPPEGAVAGVLARRALARGAWIAPANEPLGGVVALTPDIPREARQALQDAQVNLVRQEPAGFLMLSADTLSADADLVPIHVRRLLILLRRAALRLGATYVFEPNDRALRRLVQRGFEAMLGRMFALGAFAGSTERAAFQVVPDAEPTSASGVAEGRFSVDLRVAPASPMTFLTVRLVQSGDLSRVTEVR